MINKVTEKVFGKPTYYELTFFYTHFGKKKKLTRCSKSYKETPL